MIKNNKYSVLGESGIPIWALREDELFPRLGADTVHGLSAAEAAERLESVGPNAISQSEQTPAWVIFLRQFKSPSWCCWSWRRARRLPFRNGWTG
jgi:magnesium-transporting ATPase (P-type)